MSEQYPVIHRALAHCAAAEQPQLALSQSSPQEASILETPASEYIMKVRQYQLRRDPPAMKLESSKLE